MRLTKIFVAMIILLMSANAWAVDVTLTWDPPEAANPIGYRIYRGEAAGVYTTHADAGTQLTYTMQGLEQGKTYYFAATALYEDDLESGYSNEVFKVVPVVGSPGNLRVTKMSITLEATP